MFLPDEGVLRAEEKCEQVATLNTESLERPMTTEAPITDIPTTAYFHGPMPDRAISQHFVSRRNTAAIIDGSGQNLQTVEVPMTAADPNFYFLRDGDGTRRTLEVRDETDDVDMRAHGRAMEELSKVKIMYMLAFCRQAGSIARSHAWGLAGLGYSWNVHPPNQAYTPIFTRSLSPRPLRTTGRAYWHGTNGPPFEEWGHAADIQGLFPRSHDAGDVVFISYVWICVYAALPSSPAHHQLTTPRKFHTYLHAGGHDRAGTGKDRRRAQGRSLRRRTVRGDLSNHYPARVQARVWVHVGGSPHRTHDADTQAARKSTESDLVLGQGPHLFLSASAPPTDLSATERHRLQSARKGDAIRSPCHTLHLITSRTCQRRQRVPKG